MSFYNNEYKITIQPVPKDLIMVSSMVNYISKGNGNLLQVAILYIRKSKNTVKYHNIKFNFVEKSFIRDSEKNSSRLE